MVLIKCPECEQIISNAAKQCPHCGYPLSQTIKNAPKEVVKEKIVVEKENNLGCIVTVFLLIILYAIYNGISSFFTSLF